MARNYGPQTIAAPFQAAIDRYRGDSEISPEAREAAQGAFHPSGLAVTDPIVSRMWGGPTNASANPQADALHAAIARYYGGA